MKTLVILLGSARGGEQTWKTMYHYLLEPYSAELALCFGKTKEHNLSLYDRAKYIWELEEYQAWSAYYQNYVQDIFYEYSMYYFS